MAQTIDFEPEKIDFQPEQKVDFTPSDSSESPLTPEDRKQLAEFTAKAVAKDSEFGIPTEVEGATSPEGKFTVGPESVLEPLKKVESIYPEGWKQVIEFQKTDPGPEGTVARVASGMDKVVSGVASSLTSPVGIASIPLGGILPEAGHVIAAGFGLKGAYDIASKSPEELHQAFSTGDAEKITEAVGNLVVNALMATGAISSMKGFIPNLKESAPRTAQVMEEVSKSASKINIASYKGETLSLSDAAREQQQLQTGTSTRSKGGIGVKAVEGEQSTPIAWLKGLSENNPKEIADAETKMFGESVEGKTEQQTVLGRPDIGGAEIRAPSVDVSKAGQTAAETRTLPPQEREWIGQLSGKSSTAGSIEAYESASLASPGPLGQALRQMLDVSDPETSALGARTVLDVLSKKLPPEVKTQIIQQIKDIAYARKNFSPAKVHGSMRSFSEQGLRQVPTDEGGQGVQSQAQGGIQEAPVSSGELTKSETLPAEQAVKEVKPVETKEKGIQEKGVLTPTEEPASSEAPTYPEDTPTMAHIQATPEKLGKSTLGIVAPGSISIPKLFEPITSGLSEVGESLGKKIVASKRGIEMQSLPRITQSDMVTGEKGVRFAASRIVARSKGLEFSRKVLEGTGVDPIKFGAALTEDNLRSIKEYFKQQSDEAIKSGDSEGANEFGEASKAVASVVGIKNSPFKTEAEYQDFLNSPETKVAIERHKQLWSEQKDPLYRQANDLDPDTELPTRGLQTGARINLKAIIPGEPSINAVGSGSGFRQLSTLLKKDVFSKRATGLGKSYEINYDEIMANGFQREMPVAKQHDFIKSMLDSGNAELTDREYVPNLEVKGEPTKGFILKLRPWSGKFIQVPSSLAGEFQSVMGLTEPFKIPYYTKAAELLTRQSLQGLAEGTTHSANLLMEVFTGIGPTSNPMINAVMKSLGRADLLYRIPRVFIKAMKHDPAKLMEIAEIGATKEGFKGGVSSKILDPLDKAVRLDAAELYKNMAKEGWVEDTETGLREFVNQVGNYNKSLQPKFIRYLRESQIQPFATASHTFNVMALRRLGLGPGAKAPTKLAATALRADVLGGWIGFITLTAGLNKIISGNLKGPEGTPLGAVGWVGDDNKTHYFHIGRLLGYDRALRITGTGKIIEGVGRGMAPNVALKSGSESAANAAISYVTGPGIRFGYVAATGKTPSIPSFQEAPVVPPLDEFNVLKTQIASNIETALKEANPVVSSVMDLKSGKGIQEVLEKQASRYAPKSASSIASSDKFGEIVNRASARDYADYIAREARKLPKQERQSYISDRIEKDNVPHKYIESIMSEIKRKGVFKYE